MPPKLRWRPRRRRETGPRCTPLLYFVGDLHRAGRDSLPLSLSDGRSPGHLEHVRLSRWDVKQEQVLKHLQTRIRHMCALKGFCTTKQKLT